MSEEIKSKKCSKCGEVRRSEMFGKSSSSKSGLKSQCNVCRKLYAEKNKTRIQEYRKAYQKKNKERLNAISREYQKENKERLNKKSREYYEENKHILNPKRREYWANNRETLTKQKRDHYHENRDHIIIKRKKEYYDNIEYNHAKQKEYRAKNKLEINKRIYNRKKVRLYNDPYFKLKEHLRHRVYLALKYNNSTKNKKTMELIGCNIEQAKSHIESLFLDGMSWENHGLHGWHIDHIKPCASFDLTDPEQQKQCFCYKNLQPLWAIDNLKKGSKHES